MPNQPCSDNCKCSKCIAATERLKALCRMAASNMVERLALEGNDAMRAFLIEQLGEHDANDLINN